MVIKRLLLYYIFVLFLEGVEKQKSTHGFPQFPKSVVFPDFSYDMILCEEIIAFQNYNRHEAKKSKTE